MRFRGESRAGSPPLKAEAATPAVDEYTGGKAEVDVEEMEEWLGDLV